MIRRIKKKRELLKLNDFLNGLDRITYNSKDISYHLHGIMILYIEYSCRKLCIKSTLINSVQLDYDLVCIIIKSKYHLENYAVTIIP